MVTGYFPDLINNRNYKVNMMQIQELLVQLQLFKVLTLI